MSNQRGGERSELLELPHLALKPRILECAFGDQQQTIGLERLFDEIIGAALDRGHRGFDIAMARNHDDRQFGMLLLEAVEQLQAIKPAALQPNIEENEIGPARNYGGKRLVAVAGRAGAMALVLQNARDQLADICLIVDDQDIGCHAVTSSFSCALFRCRARTTIRPRPSSAGGTAPIASVAFLMIFVSACEIRRLSKRADIVSASSS